MGALEWASRVVSDSGVRLDRACAVPAGGIARQGIGGLVALFALLRRFAVRNPIVAQAGSREGTPLPYLRPTAAPAFESPFSDNVFIFLKGNVRPVTGGKYHG